MVLYYILLPLAWIVFHIGFRVRAEGRDNLKKIRTRGYILAPNHISAIDPVFVIITRFWGRRMIVFAKKELFEINAFLSWFFRCAGAMCVRGTKEEAAVIDETVARCQNGESLLIFPEGTREKDGTFLQPKSGLFVIAAAAAVDVVPGAHPLRDAGRKNEAVLQGAGGVRRADARRPVCHGEPPRYEEAPRQQAGASGRMGETVKERTWRFV